MDSKTYSQSITISEITDISASVGSLMLPLMDPNSLALCIERGEGTFTNRGCRIISEVVYNHPIEKLIINSVQKYYLECGADCKIYLLLFRELMLGIKKLLNKYDELYVRKTIHSEIGFLLVDLPGVFESVRKMAARISKPSNDSFEKDLQGIVLTFFDSAFPVPVSRNLSQLMCRFLLDSIADWTYACESIAYMVSNFDLFCSKQISVLKRTSILKGFLLQHVLTSAFEKKDVPFVIILNLSYRDGDACWQISDDSLISQLGLFWNPLESSLNYLKAEGISVILSSDASCQNFKSLCLKNNVLIVDRIPEAEIKNVSFLSGVLPMYDLNDVLEPQNIGIMRSISAVEDTNYTHIDVVERSGFLIPHHLLLCSPVNAQWKNYFSECLNCVKTVLNWLQPYDYSCKSNFYTTENFSFEYEYLEEKEQLYANYSSWGNDTIGLSFPLNLWEFALKKVLNDRYKNTVQISELQKILDFSLLQLICKIWNTTLRNYQDEETYKIFQSMKIKLVCPIESVSAKESMMFSVLQMVQQLLRIDAIVSIN